MSQEDSISQDDYVPASYVQRQFWLLHQKDKTSSAYNVPSCIHIRGNLDLVAFSRAFEKIVERHEVLRTVFTVKDNLLFQKILPNLNISILVRDCKDSEPSELEQVVQEYVRQPFDLEHGPLIRGIILKAAVDHHIWVFVGHHAIIDGQSKDLFGDEFSALYAQLVGKHDAEPPLPDFQYRQYALSQQQWIQTPEYDRMLSFWKKNLAECGEALNLCTDRSRPAVQTFTGDKVAVKFDAVAVYNLWKFSSAHATRPYAILLTAYMVLLHRYSGQDSITVGVPRTNRCKPEYKKAMGCFAHNLPLWIDLADDPSFLEVLDRVKRQMRDIYSNQMVPFELIVKELDIPLSLDRNPIFQVGFTLKHPMIIDLPDLDCESVSTFYGGAQLDLFAEFWESPQKIDGEMVYNTDLFDHATVTRIADNYRSLVVEGMENPNLPISQFAVINSREKALLLSEWNNTRSAIPEPSLLHKLFEKQVNTTPNAPAIVFNEITVSYQELNCRANRLARVLRKKGVIPDSIVGIYMERSIEMLVAMYAILKAGGAYLPLDPEYPSDRLDFMAMDSKVSVILTHQVCLDKISFCSNYLICIDAELSRLDEQDDSDLDVVTEPHHLAYIIYTSGSTGRPKGVMIEHLSIVNRLAWMQDYFNLMSTDTVLQKTPYSFDVSVWEFFWPLLYGARLAIADPMAHRDPRLLAELIEKYEVTTVHFVPSMLDIFLRSADLRLCRSLRCVICSGEALPVELRHQFLKNFDIGFYNLYGPTEAAVDVTVFDCNQDLLCSETVPIGRPIANTTLYVLNRAMKPVPIGAVGDLWIGGVQLARGYLNREDLNAASFVKDPFSASIGGRLYKTGDLAKWHATGNLEYCGRIDHQVKIRGNRIELSEISSVLEAINGVDRAIVSIRSIGKDRKLVAYIVYSKDAKISQIDLRAAVRTKLPQYMYPEIYVRLEMLPLLQNGKVNHKALPEPMSEMEIPEQPHVPPSGYTQIKLHEIWKKHLKREQLSIFDKFFDLGGDSFLAIQLTSDMEKVFDRRIPVALIFQFSSIDALAAYLDSSADSAEEQTVASDRMAQRRASRARRRQL